MPLRRISLEFEATAIPPEVARLLDEAQARTETFVAEHLDRPVPGFFPSDFPLVYHALLWLSRQPWRIEGPFCEWGSGLGVVACLAALHGMRAYGIECDQRLVAAARRLSGDLAIPAQFFTGSFVPPGAVEPDDLPGGCLAWLDLSARSAYGSLGLDPGDFAVIYAYPWPGEERVVLDLFDDYASPGALLLTFHGAEDLRLHQKLAGRSR